MAQYGARRVLILTDLRINELGIPARIADSLTKHVSLTAPEAFRFSFPSAPERHLQAAALLAPDRDTLNDPGEQLPSAVIDLMRDIEIPNGIGAVGYTEADIGDLVPGTMKQQRLLATCPRPVDEEDIAGIFAHSIENW